MEGNLLSGEASPYLLQHKDNPVHWRPWGPAALAEARATRRPILLSIGYAACHWCHVMARESFEDEATAAVMNRLYVNIKVDREERPDVDQVFMAALHAMGEQGGWPLTMFLTPDAHPVWGGTYFPNTARYGRPAFTEVLEWFAATLHAEPGRIEASRAAPVDHLRTAPELRTGSLTPATLDEAGDLIARLIDHEHGGLRGAPKFPQPTLLELLARRAARSGAPSAEVTLTLRHLSQGGIYDHIGGGLARYSVDDRWLVPHFEKMLYDNALFVDRLTQHWLETGEPLFRARIEETVGWLFREMAVEEAFAASLDADTDHEEGATYVWRPAEVAAVLGPARAAAFCAAYDITEAGNFEGASIPNRLKTMAAFSPEEEARLTDDRKALLAARAKRPQPGRDDKILTDWNGLMIAALARAGAALDRRDWLERAAGAYRFITESSERHGRLIHSRRGAKHLGLAFATDYAGALAAALALHQATLDDRYLTDAAGFVAVLDREFWDGAVGAYRLTSATADAEALFTRPLPIQDESIPSATALIATSLVTLASLTGRAAYAERADAILAAHLGAARDVLGRAGLFNALDQRMNLVEVAVIGTAEEGADALIRAVRRHWRDAIALVVGSGDVALPESHPAHGKTTVGGRAAAFVCRSGACSLPVTDVDELAPLLKRLD
ncbi:MAG: thioredoxin domain-containing protein [Bauldia sp.]|nr:thioredoxin domain-containing protein [Bauldia sp.]